MDWNLAHLNTGRLKFAVGCTVQIRQPGCSAVGKVKCLAADTSDCRSRGREFDPGPSHAFVDIDHEIISATILVPSADSRRVVVSYKRKYVHEELLCQACPEKSMVTGQVN